MALRVLRPCARLRTIPDRTGHNTAHCAARPVAIAVTIIVAVIVVVVMFAVVMVMMIIVVRVALVALPFVLAGHLHDIARTRELRQR